MLGGDVTPTGDVLFYDDNGTHSALSAAEMIARSGANLEIVTPGADVRHRGRRHEPRAVRPGVQRDRHPHHAAPAGAERCGPSRAGCVSSSGATTPATARCDMSTGSSPTHGTAALADVYFELKDRVVEPRCRRLRRADRRSAAGSRAQPRRRVPAVPDRRCREQPQHPRRRLRRAAPREGSLEPLAARRCGQPASARWSTNVQRGVRSAGSRRDRVSLARGWCRRGLTHVPEVQDVSSAGTVRSAARLRARALGSLATQRAKRRFRDRCIGP